jgi:predicted RNase H-like HicB family nuclease
MEVIMTYQLPLEISREESIWMARSSMIQGLLVTGETLDQLFAELPAVAQALFEVCREKGWTFIQGAPEVQPNDIVWVFQLPQPVLQVA